MMKQLDRVPDIDYESHPAFSGLTAASDAVNRRADALVQDIDAAYNAAQNTDAPLDAFELSVAPLIAALAHLAKDQPVPPAFGPFLAEALDIARDTLRQNMTARGRPLS